VRKVDPVGDGRRTAADGMEICVGRQLLAPSVWARDVEVYDATVRIDAALPQRRGLFGADAKPIFYSWRPFRRREPLFLP
jgi:hypothetical protein